MTIPLTRLTPLILFAISFASPAFAADDAALIKKSGTLLFEDAFERDEATPGKEDIGGGWTSNSAWRAKGSQQVDLVDGTMQITLAPGADHAAVVFHDAAFRDGAVQMKFKLKAGDSLGLDFVDRELKSVHAGHLAYARITLRNIRLQDSKTGAMDNKIRDRRKAGDKSPEMTKLLKSKQNTFPLKLAPEEWHTVLIVVQGDAMRATIDGKFIGEFKSPGIAHPTKRMITLVVSKVATIDDIKVWKLTPVK
ncbi:MAG: hypothetical protein GXP30_04835 [Verrucomicrobia bacterium]|nr:hypothetical protein [Verrucomicrobiota bacterium]